MTISPPKSESSDEIDRKLPWLVIVGVLTLMTVMIGLGRLAIINSDRRDAEKKRGDAEAKRGDDLQKSVEILRSRAEEEQHFMELIRQLLVAQNAEERQALVDELRGFQFEPIPTTTTTRPSATQTPSNSSVTTAPRPPPQPPPSTTTTTQPPPRTPPSTTVCISTPVRQFCT